MLDTMLPAVLIRALGARDYQRIGVKRNVLKKISITN
jgi:hypothetical protein